MREYACVFGRRAVAGWGLSVALSPEVGIGLKFPRFATMPGLIGGKGSRGGMGKRQILHIM